MGRRTARAVGAMAFCAAAGLAGCRPARVESPRPASAPVLVTIVVDQLGAWMAAERWPALPAAGGFARLRAEGLYARQLRYGHAVTDTAPGHSALYTGAVPRASGIVANEILDDAGRPVSIVDDRTTRAWAAGAPGPSVRSSASLAALRVPTLADTLQAQRPGAVVVSLSIKDRSALFGGGRRPAAALWLDGALGAFVTSTGVAATPPAWAASAGDVIAVARARAAPWTPRDTAWVAAHAAAADEQPGEGDYDGLGVTFPHTAGSARTLRATPAGDALVLGLARAALAPLAARPPGAPALLALSLSAHDYVGHVFGPDSWELWDELLRLDAALAELLRALDRAFGPEGYAVMLSGDHGNARLPETPAAPCPGGDARPTDEWQRPCGPGRRLQVTEVTQALRQAAAAAGFGEGAIVAGLSEPYVYLRPDARALPAADRTRLVSALRDTLRSSFAVDDLVDVRGLTADCPPLSDESLPALVCRSAPADGPGDLYIVPAPGTFFDAGYTPGAGASHGSPYLYDRAVPLLVRAPGRVPAGVVRNAPLPYTAFIRTAATLLGVAPPETAAAGPDLVRPRAGDTL